MREFHCPELGQLLEHARDGLVGPEAKLVESHLAACEPCREQVRLLRELTPAFEVPVEEPPRWLVESAYAVPFESAPASVLHVELLSDSRELVGGGVRRSSEFNTQWRQVWRAQDLTLEIDLELGPDGVLSVAGQLRSSELGLEARIATDGSVKSRESLDERGRFVLESACPVDRATLEVSLASGQELRIPVTP